MPRSHFITIMYWSVKLACRTETVFMYTFAAGQRHPEIVPENIYIQV